MHLNTIKIDHPGVRLIAHRGLSGIERENTCPAFVAAGNRSYWGIETDVRRTADGKYILLHDSNTRRVSEGEASLVASESTLEQLKSVILPDLGGDTSRTDIRIPTLEEYVWICKKYQKYCVLEIKDVFSEEEIKDVIRVYSAAEYLDHLVVISFSMRSCLRARKLLPNNRVQLLAGELSEEARRTALENRLDVDLYYPAVDAALVKEFHEKDLLVNCYTVNTPEVAEQLIALGVDMITSNILE